MSLFASPPPPAVPSNATLYLPIQRAVQRDRADRRLQSVRPRAADAARRRSRRFARPRPTRASRRSSSCRRPPARCGRSCRKCARRSRTSRRPGSRVTAYLESGGAQEYYLASAADRDRDDAGRPARPARPRDLRAVLPRRARQDRRRIPTCCTSATTRRRRTPSPRRRFTPAHREMTQSLNRDWYDELVRAIAAGRKTAGRRRPRGSIDGGPYLAEAALKAGLVDALAYEDQLDDDGARSQGTQPARRRDVRAGAAADRAARERRAASRCSTPSARSRAARAPSTAPAAPCVGSDTFVQWLRKVRVDPSVRAIVVRIDSPGGSAIASEVIWRELMLTRDVKPRHRVDGRRGRVGRLLHRRAGARDRRAAGHAHRLDRRRDRQVRAEGRARQARRRHRGRDATASSPRSTRRSGRSRPTSGRASKSRCRRPTTCSCRASPRAGKQPTAKIDAVAQGRVWTGRQARERGLVDELGGLDRAIRIAKERRASIRARSVDLVVYPPKRSLFDIARQPVRRVA